MTSEMARQAVRINHLTSAIADLEVMMTAIYDLRISVMNAIGKINAQASQIGAMGNHVAELMKERGELSSQLDAANTRIADLVASLTPADAPTEPVSDLELVDLTSLLNAALDPVAAAPEPQADAPGVEVAEPHVEIENPVPTVSPLVVDGKNPNS